MVNFVLEGRKRRGTLMADFASSRETLVNSQTCFIFQSSILSFSLGAMRRG